MIEKRYNSLGHLGGVRDGLRRQEMIDEDRKWESLKDKPISSEIDETAQTMMAITLEDRFWKRPNSKRTVKLRNIVYDSLCEFRRCRPVEIE